MRRYRRVLQVGLLLVVAAFIASLFVFGQRGFGDGAGRDSVATVNGEPIPYARYQRRYQAYTEAYAQMYRDRFSAELAERLRPPPPAAHAPGPDAPIPPPPPPPRP